MKTLFLVITIYFTLTVSVDTEKELWQQYKQKHNKSYPNLIEEQFRFKVFQEKLRKIEEHNLKYEQGTVSWQMGINQFSDWTDEEFNNILNHNLGELANVQISNYKPQVRDDIPDSIDWRETGAVLGVKDQAACGSCWTFATTGTLEGQNAIKHGSKTPLSEQYIMDCGRMYQTNGCNGGYFQNALMYVRDFGIVSEEDYPYKAVDLACNGTNNNKVNLTVVDLTRVNPTEEDLKQAVATIGPIAVAMDAQGLSSYGQGIYQNPDCDQYGFNHAILVVGYGSENGLDYWIVKNSWGILFGEDGYFRIIRNANDTCGFPYQAYYPVIL